jgi:hypothetical protein
VRALLETQHRLGRVEEVSSADDARCVAGRGKRVREGGGCSPAGAVSWGDDSRLDKGDEVVHRRFDSVFDGRAGEVVAAEEEIDRLVGV